MRHWSRVPLLLLLATTACGRTDHNAGARESPRYFLYDYDHDGDVDFFERSGEGQLALRANHANASFDAPRLLSLNVWGSAETPFLEVGPGSGIVAHPNDNDATSAVYTLVREAPPPN